jgi:hypothetical protein
LFHYTEIIVIVFVLKGTIFLSIKIFQCR